MRKRACKIYASLPSKCALVTKDSVCIPYQIQKTCLLRYKPIAVTSDSLPIRAIAVCPLQLLWACYWVVTIFTTNTYSWTIPMRTSDSLRSQHAICTRFQGTAVATKSIKNGSSNTSMRHTLTDFPPSERTLMWWRGRTTHKSLGALKTMWVVLWRQWSASLAITL